MFTVLTHIVAALLLVATFALACVVYGVGLILIAGFWGWTMPTWLGLLFGGFITTAKLVSK